VKSAIEVLMINGGGNRSINYQSHLLHLKQMNSLLLEAGLQASQITIMSADGSDPAADLAVREERTADDAWMLDGTDLENLLRAPMEFKNSKIDGVALLPATHESLRKWFDGAGNRLQPRDTLFLYVTDHGTKNKNDTENNRITLWGKDEYLDVSELRSLLAKLKPGVRVVQLMSQCYSGSFAGLMDREAGDALPSGDVCGFYSSTRERQAYGCYPESRDKENIGHSFRFIEAVAAGFDFAGAHNQVLAVDDTPDVPLKTSDVYLKSLLEEWSGKRDQPLDSSIDELLREAWSDAGKWEPDIRLLDRISESFGYFSPRFLSELERNSGELDKVSQAFDDYGKKWKSAYQALNRDNLQSFRADNPYWSKNTSKEAITGLSQKDRYQLARRLLPALDGYTRGDTSIMSRMELLKRNSEDTGKARYRMEVRQGVVLRLRTLLTSIAGRVYVEKHATEEQRKAYHALTACEAFAPVKAKKSAPAELASPTFPSFDEELELGKTILPGWMGIRYNPVDPGSRDRFGLGSGAVTVSAVLSNSPAQEAGLQAGDIIIGPPGEAFSGRDRIREWVMTSPIGVPRPLDIQRGGRRFQISFTPMPEPGRWSDAARGIKVGSAAPSLDKLQPYRGTPPGEAAGDASYVLFFFATWCAPCKASLPELGAFEEQRRIPVIAVTDEPFEKLDAFFEKRKGYFPKRVMMDTRRESFLAYGVHGTPTFVLVDHGRVKDIKVGYSAGQGLRLE
jgi:thiol-disulfide isomerase/thioredoxin